MIVILDEPLTTEHLVLRSLGYHDADGSYLVWMNDRDVMRYTESRFSSHDVPSLRAFIAAMNDSKDSLLAGLFDAGSGEHVGNVKLGPIERHHAHAYIGIIIGDKSRWGQGLASEAIGVVADYAFNSLGLSRLAAGVYASNAGSLRAFTKAGFREVARLPRWYRCDGEQVDDVILMRERST